MKDNHALINNSLVAEHLVAFVRAENDGSYNVADALNLYEQLEGMLPCVGDFLTTSYNDGFAFSIEIIARHRVEFPDRKDVCWCLVFKDVEESTELAKLHTCMLNLNTARKRRPPRI